MFFGCRSLRVSHWIFQIDPFSEHDVEMFEEQNDGLIFEVLAVVFMETQDARMIHVSAKKKHYL